MRVRFSVFWMKRQQARRPEQTMRSTHAIQLAASLGAFVALPAHALEFFGPTPYLSAADTPAGFASGVMDVEDCEDGVIDPRLSTTATIIPPGGITDSVDVDDGSIDGSGLGGHSLFGFPPFEVQFVPPLPVSAGLVWTDGGTPTEVTFEAFGADGLSLGIIGPFPIGDNNNVGGTDEDRFFGVRDEGGILRLRVSHTSGGIEIDHIQFNAGDMIFADGFEFPPPAVAWAGGAAPR
jgi:hypothetical protein